MTFPKIFFGVAQQLRTNMKAAIFLAEKRVKHLDAITGGSMDQPRMITYKNKKTARSGKLLGIPNYLKVPLGTSIQSSIILVMWRQTFTIIIRKILRCLQRWALSVFGCLFPGRGFVQKEPERSTKTAWLFMMQFSMSC